MISRIMPLQRTCVTIHSRTNQGIDQWFGAQGVLRAAGEQAPHRAPPEGPPEAKKMRYMHCLLYTSDAADE